MTPSSLSGMRMGPTHESAQRRCRTAAILGGLVCAALLGASGTAVAQPASASPPPGSPAPESAAPVPDADADAKLEEAKEFFFQGESLREAGDCQRALLFYAKSRALVPSVPNTLNAGICLTQLGRFDEALETYESVLTEFREKLTADERQLMGPEMATLRKKVGAVDVSANVDGTLVIDGRSRGSLPLFGPVRALPGSHVVRVLKNGYESFETRVDVAVGQTVSVDAKLTPLANAGRVEIDDGALEGADVYVDGALVGTVPWEGSLAPGVHRLHVRKGDVGSAPTEVTVVQGQTAKATLVVGPLGPEMQIRVEPPTAELLLGAVALGAGRWQGRLPHGSYELTAREEGYESKTQRLEVGAESKGAISWELEVDASHPRWASSEAGSFLLDAFGGFAFAPSLGSGAEGSCSETGYECSSNPFALGFMAGARGGYEFPFGLSIDLAIGYLRTTKTVERSHSTTFGAGHPIQYDLRDALLFHGPFAAVGLGYRLPFAEIFEFRAHALVGPMLTYSKDGIEGTVSAGGQTLPAAVVDNGKVASAVDFVVLPDLALGVRVDGFGVSVGMSAALLALSGPDQANGAILPSVDPAAPCLVGTPEMASCATAQTFTDTEPSYGPAIVLVPSVSVGYAF